MAVKRERSQTYLTMNDFIFRRNSADDRERYRKADELRQNHAARRIQTGWRQHHKAVVDEDEVRAVFVFASSFLFPLNSFLHKFGAGH